MPIRVWGPWVQTFRTETRLLVKSDGSIGLTICAKIVNKLPLIIKQSKKMLCWFIRLWVFRLIKLKILSWSICIFTRPNDITNELQNTPKHICSRSNAMLCNLIGTIKASECCQWTFQSSECTAISFTYGSAKLVTGCKRDINCFIIPRRKRAWV